MLLYSFTTCKVHLYMSQVRNSFIPFDQLHYMVMPCGTAPWSGATDEPGYPQPWRTKRKGHGTVPKKTMHV